MMFDWILKLFRRIKQPRISYVLSFPFEGLSALGNAEAYLKAYGEIGWLFACVSRIASSLGEAEWRLVSRRDGKERPIDNHPLLDLIHRVNPFLTGQELMEYTQMWLDLAGEAFWIFNLNRMGQPMEIWPVPPNRMKIVPSKEKFIAGYIYRYGKEKIPFEPEEVLQFKYPHPLNMYRGLGPVQALAVDLDTESFAAKWNRNFFLNSARPDGVLEMAGQPSQEQFDTLKKEWAAGHKGVKRAHRIAVLTGGTTYKQISLSHKEMDFGLLRKGGRDIILGAYGMPLHMLGVEETTNRATAESAEYVFARWVLRPRLQRLMHKMNEQFTPRFGENLKLLYTDPTPENREEARLDAESGVQAGYMSINEARQLMGLEAIPAGDVLMWGALTMPAPIKQMKEIAITVRQPLQLPEPKAFSDEAKERIGELFIRRADAWEKPFKRAMLDFYTEQEKAIVEALEARKQLGEEIYNEELWGRLLRELGRPLITTILREAAEDAVSDYGLGIDFDLANPRVQRWVGDRLKEFSTNVNKTQKEAIIAQLREAEAAGESIPQMVNRIKEHYEGKDYMAERVARTETIYASNNGAIEAYAQAGVERWEWLATEDERTCEICMALDGKTYPISRPFEIAHPNCRCAALPVLPEEAA